MSKQDTISDHRPHDSDTGLARGADRAALKRISHLTDHLRRTPRTTTAGAAC